MRQLSILCGILVCIASAGPVAAQCTTAGGTGGVGPDVVVGGLTGPDSYGSAGGFYAYAIGTVACNVGTEELEWMFAVPEHPVIATNLYRLKEGRFEQVGMSWIKHGFGALQQSFCSCTCVPSGGFSALGVGCSDPYRAWLNGFQGDLAVRSEVSDPALGTHPGFAILAPPVADLTYRRLRVAAADIDPSQNLGALYFGEGHYLAPDDAAAGNAFNNASHRAATVGSSPALFPLSFTGPTFDSAPALQAWQNNDPEVELTPIDTDDGGRMILGARVYDNGNGTFDYEYALYNMDSTWAGRAFHVPVSSGLIVTSLGFHDIDSHSGEVYDTTDWDNAVTATGISWEVTGGSTNALRWGTLYNFRFTADSGPTTTTATVDYFDTTGSIEVVTLGPSAPANPEMRRGDCNSDTLIDIADAIGLLDYRFSGGTVDCEDACDANDDGAVNIADAIRILSTLFAMGPPLDAPSPDCGDDPTTDTLTCATPSCP